MELGFKRWVSQGPESRFLSTPFCCLLITEKVRHIKQVTFSEPDSYDDEQNVHSGQMMPDSAIFKILRNTWDKNYVF